MKIEKPAGRGPLPGTEVETTVQLIDRARAGDRAARDAICERYLPRLRRWASGRLPRWARDVTDTQDLVQETLLQTFRKIESFESRGELGFQLYVRQAIANRIRDEVRRAGRRPGLDPLATDHPDAGRTPLEAAIGTEAVERYDAALSRVPESDRELIVARVELGYSYMELAEALGKPSAEAARKACERALVRLAGELQGGPDGR